MCDGYGFLKMFDLQEMSLLEMKHGLLQVSESLEFLHSNARLLHRAISPEVIASPFMVSSVLTYYNLFLLCKK